MVASATSILQKRPNGFFLLAESGLVDYAHHYGQGRRAMEEVLELDKAFSAAKQRLNPQESLIITTADHAHVFSIGGYPARGTDILRFPTQDTEGTGIGKARDGKLFTILNYANGPGAKVNALRDDLSKVDVKSATYQQQALVPLKKETHGGDDVAIYATGPMSHAVKGVHEQNYIAHVFMNAGCLGPYSSAPHCRINAAAALSSNALLSFVLLMASLALFC